MSCRRISLALSTTLLLGSAACHLNRADGGRVDSQRSKLLRELLISYTANAFDGWRAHVAEDAAASWNNREMDGVELIAGLAAAHTLFDAIELKDLRVVTVADAGEAATSFARTMWCATVRSNGARVALPIQITVEWSGDRIVAFHEVFDNGALTTAMGAGG